MTELASVSWAAVLSARLFMAISSRLRRPAHPFRLLLYLEWVLLGTTVLTLGDLAFIDLVIDRLADAPNPLWAAIAIALFGLMGVWLPTRRRRTQWLYVGLELALVAVAAWPYECIECFLGMLLIISIRGGLMFGPRGRLWLAAGVFGTFVLAKLLESLTWLTWEVTPGAGFSIDVLPALHPTPPMTAPELLWTQLFQAPLYFGLMLMLMCLTVNALIGERHSRQQLAIAHRQLRDYALRVEDQATLQERNRIAREIHDSMGHLLTAQRIQLENAGLFLGTEPDRARQFLTTGQTLAGEALQALRQSVAMLRADPLQGRSLPDALAKMIGDFSERTAITPTTEIHLPPHLPQDWALGLYRIVQEALTNSAKYSRATALNIHLAVPPDQQVLRLAIADNGRGFDPSQNRTGFGLQGMRERAASLGAPLQITSRPGQGCKISADFPLPVRPHDSRADCG